MSLFHWYLAVISGAAVASLYNLKRGEWRLTVMALAYLGVIAGFHELFFDQYYALGLMWYLLVAFAQGLIVYIALEIRCMAAKLIRRFAWLAIYLNLASWVFRASYDHTIYWWAMNLIQGAQVASLFVANYAFIHMAKRIWAVLTKKQNGLYRMGDAHESFK